ncbi:MAG: hypothetical protein IT212_10520 [Bacteroidia bacterium]|nr:hypothetical protein [Bacteroidota bacterium]MCC7515110.1 hypothetical protein [Bacteroidia bacterium]
MRKVKPVIYTILVAFILYTLYKVVLIYVLNVLSLKSSYIYHSKSIEISKGKGLYIATYRLDKSAYKIIDTLIPKVIFVEKEKVIYPQYYFYWGKSEIGNRVTTDGTVFLELAKSGKYYISCPSSTLPNEKENIDNYRKNLYFFFEEVPSEITFIIDSIEPKPQTDTLTFKKVME